MAVSQTGNAYLSVVLDDYISVVVPTDAVLAIAFGKHYAAPTGAPVLGSSMTLIARAGNDPNDRPLVDAWYLINPPTGAQTLYFREADGFSDTYRIGVAFYTGANTTTPIEDYGTSADNSDITGLTYSSGSMMTGAAAGMYNVPTVTDNSQTQLYLEDTHGFGVAQRADVGGFYFTGTGLNAVAIIIAPLASAATALPRRALDGPFYGSLRGSVR